MASKLPGMDLKGGKGSMTEAGSRVPLLAWWPGHVKPTVRDEFFCLVDVLPTIHAIAGIELNREVDGMDLSHLLVGGEGTNREHVLISYGRGFFVREKRFRLNQDGNLYDIPITSDASRYSEAVTTDPAHNADRTRLTKILDDFMAIESQYNKSASNSRKKKRQITASRDFDTVRIHDQPLLYVVWDERVPVVPWESQGDRQQRRRS